MTDRKHTPLPWSLPHFADKSTKCSCRYVFSGAANSAYGAICTISENHSHNESPPEPEAIANAAFIVHACNMHYELVEALEIALRQIEDLDDVLNQPNHEVYGWHLNGQPEPVSSFFEDNDHGAIANASAILARAKSGQEVE